jgi:hypothetical protein
MKITVIDVFVIIVVGLSLFSFYTKYDFTYRSRYSGSHIEDAIQECDLLDSLKFSYTVYVKGYWNLDIGHFEEEAFVIDTQKECLTLVLKDGRTVTVGGPRNYRADIQAVDIEVNVTSKSSVIYQLPPVRGTEEEISTYIETSSGFIHYPREDIAVTACFVCSADIEPSLLLESEIEDVLRRSIFFMKRVDVEIYHNELTVSVAQLSITEIATVFEIFQAYCITDVYMEKITVVYQATEEIDAEDIPTIESYEGNSVYNIDVYASQEQTVYTT